MKSRIDAVYIKHNNDRIYQGDIFRDISHILDVKIEGGKVKTETITLPYIVVLTQDCDLEKDFENKNESNQKHQDKFLQSILVCPAYISEDVRLGKHLNSLNRVMESFDNKRWRLIESNQNPRYHFLTNYAPLKITDMVIDFKHYYTIPRDKLYEKENTLRYLGSISELFRERLSQRFANYLSRIGLPTIGGAVSSEESI